MKAVFIKAFQAQVLIQALQDLDIQSTQFQFRRPTALVLLSKLDLRPLQDAGFDGLDFCNLSQRCDICHARNHLRNARCRL